MSLPRQLALRRPSESSLGQTSLHNHQTLGAVHWKELNTRSPHMWSSVARFHLFSDFLEAMKSRWCCLHLPKEGRTAAVDWALSGESVLTSLRRMRRGLSCFVINTISTCHTRHLLCGCRVQISDVSGKCPA